MIHGIYGIIEAEEFALTTGLAVGSGGGASNGKYVQATSLAFASMSKTVAGYGGTYDLKISYFDENDGVSRVTVKVDGVVIDTWNWDKNLGSSLADTQTLTTRTISNVTFDSSAVITIEGYSAKNEPMRIDRVDLMPTQDRGGPDGLASFAGAEGFGTETAGGRGGWIVKVTNLNDSGIGSLRWALEDLDAPRIVVFDVGGIINLKSEIRMNGDVTVAGQTAPGDGIVLRGARLHVAEDDVIIRGLKFRPGDGAGMTPSERDGISVGRDGEIVERVVVDSNSMSWSVDENVSVWAGAHDVTFSNNIFAEGLQNSIHPQGAHSMGMIIGDGAQRISVINNLFANNEHRNPNIWNSSVEVINNYVYNYGANGLDVADGLASPAKVNIIGNVYERGPDSALRSPIRLGEKDGGSAYYLKDNITVTRTSSSQPDIDAAAGAGLAVVKSSPVFTGSGADAMSSSLVKDYVLAHAGAFSWDRDSNDTRLINGVKTNTGGLIDSPSDVGGYKTPTVTTTLKDTDKDGIPDIYEAQLGFNPNVFDPHGDKDGDGFTNIEEYINGLITGFDAAPAREAAYTKLEAEDFVFRAGFVAESHALASGGKFIRSSSTATHVAEAEFDGGDGRYDIIVRYADENDGASRLKILVDGTTVADWAWTKQLGSGMVTSDTLVTQKFAGVMLEDGDMITLSGTSNAGEALRIDYLELVPLA